MWNSSEQSRTARRRSSGGLAADAQPLFHHLTDTTGLVPTDTARALPRAFEKRQTSDYGDFSEPSSEEVLGLRGQVEVFVLGCEEAVQKG